MKSPIRERKRQVLRCTAVVRPEKGSGGEKKYSFISVIQSSPSRLWSSGSREASSACGSTTLVTTDHRWGRYFQRGDRNNRRRQQQGHIADAPVAWHTYNKRQPQLSPSALLSYASFKCRLRRRPPGQTINQATRREHTTHRRRRSLSPGLQRDAAVSTTGSPSKIRREESERREKTHNAATTRSKHETLKEGEGFPTWHHTTGNRG